MTPKQLESGRVLVVEKPEGVRYVRMFGIQGVKDAACLMWDNDFGTEQTYLPPGSWQLLGIGSEIDFETAKDITQDEDGYYPDFKHFGMIYTAPTESLHSLIRSLGYEPDQCIVLFEPKK